MGRESQGFFNNEPIKDWDHSEQSLCRSHKVDILAKMVKSPGLTLVKYIIAALWWSKAYSLPSRCGMVQRRKITVLAKWYVLMLDNCNC